MIIDVHGHASAPPELYAYKSNLLSSRGYHGNHQGRPVKLLKYRSQRRCDSVREEWKPVPDAEDWSLRRRHANCRGASPRRGVNSGVPYGRLRVDVAPIR